MNMLRSDVSLPVLAIALLLGSMSQGGMAAGAETTQFRGFGELQLSHYDYPEYFFRNRTTGPQRDSRTELDLSKLAIEGTKPLGAGLVFEAEMTIRHQGVSGRSEPNFGGPFNDDQRGGVSNGAVELTKALLAKRFGESISVYGGRIPVAFGQLAFVDTPMDYLGTRPFEGEINFIPEDWSELGLAVSVEAGPLTTTTEIVDGLDSAGFTAYNFVADGQQGRYGKVRATEPAIVERLDLAFASGLKVGTSVYYGETSQNRPIPDMARDCDKTDRIAACGYYHAPLTLADLHGSYVSPRLRGSALLLWGDLHNAGAVNLANEKNRTNLTGFYSPVAEKAYAGSAEVGVNLAADPAKERYEPFLRFDRIDTMWDPASTADKNPVADRSVVTVGMALRPTDGFYAKVDYSRRRYHASALSYESALTAASGFKF